MFPEWLKSTLKAEKSFVLAEQNGFEPAVPSTGRFVMAY
jgi:hypothetical protein